METWHIAKRFDLMASQRDIYFYLRTDSTDPCGQFQWLRTQLKNSTADERVFIIAHVPPGYFELSPTVPFFNNDNFTQTYVDVSFVHPLEILFLGCPLNFITY